MRERSRVPSFLRFAKNRLVVQLAEQDSGFQQILFGGREIAGFDRIFGLLIEFARIGENFALGGVGRASVANVSEFETDQFFQLDQVGRHRSRLANERAEDRKPGQEGGEYNIESDCAHRRDSLSTRAGQGKG